MGVDRMRWDGKGWVGAMGGRDEIGRDRDRIEIGMGMG